MGNLHQSGIIYRVKGGLGIIDSFCFFVFSTSHHCYAPIAAPTGSGKGEKEGPGNLSLVFCWVFSLSPCCLYITIFLIGSTNSFSLSSLPLRRLLLLLFLSRSLCVRSVVLLKGFFCGLLVDLETAGVRGVSSSGERA